MRAETLTDLLKEVDGEASDTPLQQKNCHAITYMRVSTADQDEDAQRRDMANYAKEKAVTIVTDPLSDDWYRDHGSKANDDNNRSNFFRAVEHAKQDKRVSLFLVWDESRLYRDKIKAAAVKADLRAHGVSVVPVTHPYDTTTVGGLWQESIYETQAQAYSMDVREKTLKSMPYAFSQRDPELKWCYKNGGVPQFGYKAERVERGKDSKGRPKFRLLWLLDDRVEAGRPRHEWVRVLLVDWFAERGWGDDRIVAELNRLGVKPVRNEVWSKSSLRQLREQFALLTYCGYYIYGKYAVKWLGAKRKRREKRATPLAVVENAHAAILTMEQAEKVQAVVQSRCQKSTYTRHHNEASPYMLSGGLMRCKVCGAPWTGEKRGKRRYYHCGAWAYREGFNCGRHWQMPVDSIEEALLNEVVQRFPVGEAEVQAWAHEVNTLLNGDHEDIDENRRRLQSRLTELKTEATNIAIALRRGKLMDALETQAHTVDKEQSDVERELRELGAMTTTTVEVNPEDMMRFYSELSETVKNGAPEDRKSVARLFIKELTVDPDSHAVDVVLYNPKLRGFMVAPTGFVNPPHLSSVMTDLLLPRHIVFTGGRGHGWHITNVVTG